MSLYYKIDASVFQFFITRLTKVVINGSCEYQYFLIQVKVFLNIKEISADFDLDIRVINNLLDKMGVSMFREGLESIREISIIKVIPNRNTGQYTCIQFLWVFIPLFFSVLLEDLLIQNFTYTALSHLFTVINGSIIFDLSLFQPLIHFRFSLQISLA